MRRKLLASLIFAFVVAFTLQALAADQPYYEGKTIRILVSFIFIGAFAANFHSYDLTALMIFSLLGFFMRRYGWPRPPLLLGVVLGDKMELYLWLSYTRYGLEWLTRPMVIVLMVLLVASLVYPIVARRREKRAAEGPLVKV
jgi:TctA family transporter